MNRLGDAPADVLFGLIAVNNNLVAPAVIPAALRARALEPTRTLAELLVSQGALTPVQCDLVESLSGEYIERGGGDALKGLATLIATPSARERLDQLGDLGLSESLSAAASLETTLPDEPDPRLDDPDRTLLPPTNDRGRCMAASRRLRDPGGAGLGRDGDRLQGAPGAARPVRRSEDDPGRRRRAARGSRSLRGRSEGGRRDRTQQHRQDLRHRRTGRPSLFLARIPLRRQPRQEDRRQAPAGR